MPFGMHCMKQRNQRVLLSMTRSMGARNLIINSKKSEWNPDGIDNEMITEHKEDIAIKKIRREICVEDDIKKKKMAIERLANWKSQKRMMEDSWSREQRLMSQIKN